MVGNSSKNLVRTRPARLQKKKQDSRRGFYQIVDKKELETKFPTLSEVLIVRFGDPYNNYEVASDRTPLYILSESMPFVFEVSSDMLSNYLPEKYLADTMHYLSLLRRIRIIQSLKSRDLLFSQLERKEGVFAEKGQLDISFTHPLLNKKLRSLHYTVDFKKNKADELHGLILIENYHSEPFSEVEFPENCCIVSLKLTRKSVVRSFTSLVWFMEKKLKSTKVYFCAIKMDVTTKVNLYFTTKNYYYDESPMPSDGFSTDGNLVLANAEVIVGHPSCQKEFQEKFEFYSSLKKAKLNEENVNYRFNVESVKPYIRQVQVEQILSQVGSPSLEQLFFQQILHLATTPSTTLASSSQTNQELGNKTPASTSNVGISPSFKTAIEQVVSPPSPLKASSKHIPESILISSEAMLEASTDRILCIELQSLVKQLDPQEDTLVIDRLFRSILPNLEAIACGVYGNFLIQILITKLNASQRKQFLKSHSKELANLCLDTKGIFCVQTLVDNLAGDDEHVLFLRLIEENLALLVKDNQAGFVLKKAIQTFSIRYIQRLLEMIRPKFLEFASDKYGICVIKFIIRRFESELNLFREIVHDFLNYTKKGKQNSHFNFGLQHLIESANQKTWKIRELEELMVSFMAGDHKIKVRSKAVVQTIKLIYNYHDKNFVEKSIKLHVMLQFEHPLTVNEVDLLADAKQRWPDWAELQNVEETHGI